MVELRPVLHEEAVDAGELVRLRREHHDVEVEVGEIVSGELEARVVGVIDVDDTGHLVGDTLLEGLDRLGVVVGLPRCVVVGCHAHPSLMCRV